jgi:hypothetical protein
VSMAGSQSEGVSFPLRLQPGGGWLRHGRVYQIDPVAIDKETQPAADCLAREKAKAITSPTGPSSLRVWGRPLVRREEKTLREMWSSGEAAQKARRAHRRQFNINVSRPCQAPVLHPQFANKCSGGFMVATRSRDFQLGLMLATAFAVLVLPTTAEAYTPEGQQACTGDAFRLCSAEIPNVDRVRACLHRNKAQLSPGCRRFISPGAHRPAPSGR